MGREADAPARSHHELMVDYINQLHAGGVRELVSESGTLWAADDSGLFAATALHQIALKVGAIFSGEKRCQKVGDYQAIARHVLDFTEDPAYFAGAPAGIATPSGFWRISQEGEILCEPLAASHRQRFRLAWDPDFEAEAVSFDRMLADAFEGDHAEEQRDLVDQVMGAALLGMMPRLQVVALLFGREASGKSSLQRVIEAMFPQDAVCAIPPQKWGHEYYVAGLAGKLLNVVGELADDHPLPAADFKNVTGENLVTGRDPTHRPRTFRPVAAHLFASNVLPSTTDRGDAFFRRWRVVRFLNRVDPARVDPQLVERIVGSEMPAILAAAMRGAERVAKAGRIRTTVPHDECVAKWKAAANPVLQFLTDAAAVECDPEAAPVSPAAVFTHYRRWAADAGFRHPLGRNHFLDLLDATGAGCGVARKKAGDGQFKVYGLRLVGGTL